MFSCKEIMGLAIDQEELDDLVMLGTEEILIRWVNHQLAHNKQSKISNLGEDLKDCKALLHVLNALD